MTDYTDLLGLDPEAPAVDPQNPQPFVPGIGSQNVDKLPEVEGPGVWESIKGGFAIGREDDSTLNAIDRIDAEAQFKPDPNYRLEQNHNELLQGVPTHWQPILNEQLADSRSLEHSWYIRNQTLHELENSEKAAQFGAWGMLGRLGAGITDEGALTLAVIGPVAAVARAAKTASVIGKMTRLQRAGVFAGAAAVEGVGLEAIVAQGSKTRTPEDLLYAAAFSAVIGGGIGALSVPRARGAAPDKAIVDEHGLEVAPPKPTEMDGVQVGEPDMAALGQRHLKELDDAVEKDLTGQGAPAPEHPAVTKFADEVNAVNDRELGIDSTKAEDPEFEDTRGQGIQYHGTPDEITDLVGEGHYNNKNYYGNGFYSTDAQDIGVGYMRAKKGESPTLYQVDELRPVKMLDLEQPLPANMVKEARDAIGDWVDESFDFEARSGREILDEIRDLSADGMMSRDTVQDIFESLQSIAEREGYGGWSHVGGLRTGKKPHAVKIYFNPKDDIKLTKVEPRPFKTAAAKQAEKEAAAAAKQAVKKAVADARKAARQAAKDEEKLVAIDARIKEIADTDVPKPVKPTLVTELEKAREVVDRVRPILEDATLAAAKRVPADQELQQAKRHIMQVIKKESPDDFVKLKLSNNPKTEEFMRFMDTKAKVIALRLTKAHEKEMAAYDKALDKLEKELDKLKGQSEEIRLRKEQREGTVKPEPKAEPKAEPEAVFGEDSAGAASAGVRGTDLLKMDEAAIDEVLDNAPEMSAATKGRAGGYAITNRSPNAIVRWMGDKVFHDAVGTADGSKVATSSALARAQIHEEVVIGNFIKVYNTAFKGWLKDKGLSGWKRHDDRLQEEFGELVGNAIEGGTNNPHVSKAAKAASKAFEETHKYAERSGVVGFDKFKHRNDYLPHIHNSESFIAANRDLQLVNGKQRAPNWGVPHETIYQALKRAADDLDDDMAIRFAVRYVDTAMRKGEGLNGRYFDLNRIMDTEYLKSVLEEIKMDKADVDHFMYRVAKSNKAQQAGASPRAKHRALLDMDTSITVRDETGKVREFKITELYHRNAVRLVHSYVRNVGGIAAMADVTKGTPIHLNSLAKIEDLFTKMAEMEHDSAITKDRGILQNRSLDSEIEALRIGINSMIGHPVNDYSKLGIRMGMRLKNFNFTSLMGQTAFAQMSEVGSYVAHVGWAKTLKTIPQLRSMLSRDEHGNLRNELARVAEEFLGAGTTAMRGRSFSPHITDVEMLGGKRAYWMDRALHKGKLITGASMHAVLTLQQRALNVNMMQKWGDIAMGRAKLADWERARFHQVGLSDADIDKVAAQYKKFAKFEGGDGKLLNPNFDQWDDFDSFVKLREAMFQITRRVVQENDPGNVPPLMSKMGWSILTQFKSFVIGAYEKHLLNNVNALRRSGGKDFEAWANFAYQTFFAGIAYYAMVKGKTIGMDEKRKRKYEKEMLSAEKVGLNAFARTGFSSVIPTLVDTSASMAGFDAVFSGSRGSGLDQNLITGSASYSTLMHAAGAGRSLIAGAFNPDYKFSTRDLRDWQYALPFATLPGIYNLWNVVDDVANLPSRSQER